MKTLTRRDFLKITGLGGLGLTVASALSACSAKDSGSGAGGGSTSGNASGSGSTSKGGSSDNSNPSGTASPEPVENPDEWDYMEEGCFRSSRPSSVDAIPSGFTTTRDTLTIRLATDAGSLDPLNGGLAVPPSTIFSLCGTSMLAADYVDGAIDFKTNQYTVCDSITWDDDMMGVTFHIRDGVVFHNGDPVTADDLAFSVRRFSSNVRFNYVNFDGITVKDPQTLHIPLNRQDGNFLFIMGIFCRIWCEKAYNEAVESGREADFFYSSEGTCGMYEITEWVSADHVTLKADPKFFKPATIENIIIRFIPDNTVAMLELETGGVDIIYTPSNNDVANVLGGQYVDTVSGIEDPGDVMTMLGFNIAGKLSDLNLRYAITHAVDWKTVVKATWGVMGSQPTTMLAGTLYGLIDTSEWWEAMYNVDEAKACLSKSAYPNGTELTMIIDNTSFYVTASEMIKKYLSDIGINMTIETYDYATQGDKMNETEGWDLWIRDWGGYGMTWGGNFYEGGTYDKVCHPAVTEPENAKDMYDIGMRLASTLDRDVFRAAAEELQKGYLEGKYFYFFPITQPKIVLLNSASLHNWFKCKDNLYIGDAYFVD